MQLYEEIKHSSHRPLNLPLVRHKSLCFDCHAEPIYIHETLHGVYPEWNRRVQGDNNM